MFFEGPLALSVTALVSVTALTLSVTAAASLIQKRLQLQLRLPACPRSGHSLHRANWQAASLACSMPFQHYRFGPTADTLTISDAAKQHTIMCVARVMQSACMRGWRPAKDKSECQAVL